MKYGHILNLLPSELPEADGYEYYERCIADGPSRELNQNVGNVKTVAPSLTNMHTVACESLGEALLQSWLDADPDVKKYVAQPKPIMIDRPVYRKGGKKYEKATRYTGDAFARLMDSIYIVIEYKRSAEIDKEITVRKKADQECRFRFDGTRYLDPRAKAAFADIGIIHLIITEKDFGPEYYRNISLLFSYLQKDCPNDVLATEIDREFASKSVLTIEHLTLQLEKRMKAEDRESPDREAILNCVYWMLSNGRLYGDIHTLSIQDVIRFALCRSRSIAQLWVAQAGLSKEPPLETAEFRLDADTVIEFAEKSYRYLNCVDGVVFLKTEKGEIEQFDRKNLEDLFRQGSLSCQIADDEEAQLTPFNRADDKRQEVALKRAEKISWHESKVRCMPPSSFRYLKQREKAGLDQYGCALSGLLPKTGGNRSQKTCPDAAELMLEYIQMAYLGMKKNLETRWRWPASVRLENKNIQDSWGAYARICKQNAVRCVSRSTFYRAVKKVDLVRRELVNAGKKAAYQVDYMTIGEWSGMSHGLFSGHIVEIDHTLIDLEVVDDDDLSLGRLWLTLAIDTFSRAILGYHIGFGHPSRIALMMVVRDVVRRNGFMPLCISVDGGKEFHSIYFDQFCARHHIFKRCRPPSKPRYGTVIERMFRVINMDFWHTLLGSTRLMVNPRVLTKEFTAKERAIWGVSEMIDAFGSYIDSYNSKITHGALGVPPMNYFRRSYDNLLPTQKRLIRYDANFEVSCMLAPDQKKPLTCQRGGLRINSGYYTHPILREELSRNKKFSVKWSPWDLRTIYFAHRGEWHEARLSGCKFSHALSLKEVEILSNELKSRSIGTYNKDVARIFQRAEVVAEIKDQEESLKLRKARLDREQHYSRPEGDEDECSDHIDYNDDSDSDPIRTPGFR